MKDYQALKKKLKVPDNLTPHYDQVISPEEGRSLVSLNFLAAPANAEKF